MNKYKPLLDTLSGLTKNIVAVKQMSQPDKEPSDKNTKAYEISRKKSSKKSAE